MDSHWGTPNHRKRKRRRGLDRPPLPAQLVTDTRLRGDIGVLSEDLFIELFPALVTQHDTDNPAAGTDSKPCYIAISPLLTSSFVQPDAIPWTVIAVKKPSPTASGKQQPRSTLQLPQSSHSLQAFLSSLHKVVPNRTSHASVEIQILDIAPVPLDTVVVGIDVAALQNLENVNREFKEKQVPAPPRRGSFKAGHEPSSLNTSNGAVEEVSVVSDKWNSVVRKALRSQLIIYTGDYIALPVENHPITHVSAPPAVIELCGPVSQGLLLPDTKIVIVPTSTRAKRVQSLLKSPISPLPNGLSEEEEDTSNETFYSAAEERVNTEPVSKKPAASVSTRYEASDADASQEEETDLSENEEDTIGLSLPLLPTQSSGVLSAFSSATPRPGHLFHNGTASPGSVISTFSTSTVRGGSSKGRLFEAHALVSRIFDQALHPRPSPEEDDEARVFVDTTSLVRIGCFSGDWVKIEAAAAQSLSNLGMWSQNAFNGAGDEEGDWRVAKVYALPGRGERRPRYAIDRTGHRRFSQSFSHLEKAPLKVHLSPILLTNLGNPPNLRIAPLGPPQPRSQRHGQNKSRIASSSLPPFAKEVTLLRYLTPLATERSLHASLFMGLRKFFESKRRIVRDGDLIGIPIDEELGRAANQSSGTEEDQETEELFTANGFSNSVGNDKTRTNVAWFKVGPVTPDTTGRDMESEEEEAWGDVAVVQPGSTRMAQTGSEQGKLPEAVNNPWQHYLGMKQLPVATREPDMADQVVQLPKAFISGVRRRLRELIAAATSPQAIHFNLPPVAILLVSTQRQIGKATAATNACADLGLHTFCIDSYDILTEGGAGGGDVKTQGFLKARAERGLTCGPEFTALLIKHIDVLNADSMVKTLQEILEQSRILIATTSNVDKVPDAARSLFTHEIELNAPDEQEREGLLRDIVQNSATSVSQSVDLSGVAVKTAALVAGDLVDVVERATVAQQDRLEALAKLSNDKKGPDAFRVTVRDIQLSGGDASRCVMKMDFDIAVDAARKNFADAIGAPKIPNVGWDDVGGLTNVKDAVMETIHLPLERPELFAKGMKKRSGILFYGPPGTGKTLLAKAIATEFSLNFFSVKGPELLNMYIGESEANVRRVFQRARDARPCVVFFDELDSVAPKRGNQGDSGGVMDRIVSQLLAELDGMSNGEDGGGGVFVIGATNRPDLLDQALLRPGRFDKMLYLGVSDTHDKQLKILEALTRKFALSPALNLADVSNQLPFTYTGADLYALCSDAMLKAITRKATAVDSKVRGLNARQGRPSKVTVAQFFDHYAEAADTEVVVEAEDFAASIRELVPSVSVKELEHYERVKRVFELGEDQKNVLVDRPKMREFPLSNGSMRSSTRSQSSNSNTDDSYILRTADLGLTDSESDHMASVTGRAGAGPGGLTAAALAKGKGKQAASITDRSGFGYGDATDGDSDMYSL